jgi:TonB family protein
MKPIASKIFLAAALCAAGQLALAANEGVSLPDWNPETCGPQMYPKPALLEDEEGVVAIAVLVDAGGSPVDTKVLLSSGFRDLDRATQQAYLKCRYLPGRQDGQPVAMWQNITYVWRIVPNNGVMVKGLAKAALKGNAAARYKLSFVLGTRARNQAESDEAMRFLIDAAEQGEPMAQIALGTLYESGRLAAGKNMDEARYWYGMAAARGNVFAIDHLRFIGAPK